MGSSKPLAALLAGLPGIAAAPDCSVTQVTLDSRCVIPGSLFLALRGSRDDGTRYVAEAVARGAAAVVIDGTASEAAACQCDDAVPVIAVPGLRGWVSTIAGRFHDDPSDGMTVIGVTGTNGKTSVSHFVASALAEDRPVGVIGTVGSGLHGQLTAIANTTPDAVTVQAELARFRDQGANVAVMEVSSHGLDQGRVAAVRFDVGIFTNLTHEHLDYHGDMAAYAAAKRKLFDCEHLRVAVINLDDPVGRQWDEALPRRLRRIGYALAGEGRQPDLFARRLQLQPDGLILTVDGAWGRGELVVPLLGRFNAANLLAALGGLLALDLTLEEALDRLTRIASVPGRMERFAAPGRPTIVVDYAHTPDALEQALVALREHAMGRVWCLFGCGGDRDRAKRPAMGRIAERLADAVVITDDNPRSESPGSIVDAILAGMAQPEAATVIADRQAALAQVFGTAAPDDFILMAGKGHETTQVYADRTLSVSDRAEARRLTGGIDE